MIGIMGWRGRMVDIIFVMIGIMGWRGRLIDMLRWRRRMIHVMRWGKRMVDLMWWRGGVDFGGWITCSMRFVSFNLDLNLNQLFFLK
jgi:hypothetical protein